MVEKKKRKIKKKKQTLSLKQPLKIKRVSRVLSMQDRSEQLVASGRETGNRKIRTETEKATGWMLPSPRRSVPVVVLALAVSCGDEH